MLSDISTGLRYDDPMQFTFLLLLSSSRELRANEERAITFTLRNTK